MTAILDQLDAVPGGRHLRACAERGGGAAYLVGGAVRDLLLGRVPRELDVAVEGEPEVLVAALGGRVERHPRFGTAVVRGDGWCVDVARCRRETYARPGALPDVEPADIATDLERRDATINAIAVALDDGREIAAPHAREDLDAGVLRVLHDRSFVDDPTRLWRLARYRSRLGFELEPRTAALAGDAVASGALDSVSGTRLGNEFRLALREPDPVGALRSAAALGLTPWLELDEARIAAARSLTPAGGRDDLVLLAASLHADPVVLDHLGFTAQERAVVARALEVRRGRRRPAGGLPSQIAAAYRDLPPEAVALAPRDDHDAAQRWLTDLSGVGLAIDGDDLLAAGIPRGPEVGARLRAILAGVLDGTVGQTRDAQLAAAVAQDVLPAGREERRPAS